MNLYFNYNLINLKLPLIPVKMVNKSCPTTLSNVYITYYIVA